MLPSSGPSDGNEDRPNGEIDEVIQALDDLPKLQRDFAKVVKPSKTPVTCFYNGSSTMSSPSEDAKVLFKLEHFPSFTFSSSCSSLGKFSDPSNVDYLQVRNSICAVLHTYLLRTAIAENSRERLKMAIEDHMDQVSALLQLHFGKYPLGIAV